jgi:hypothetical protein
MKKIATAVAAAALFVTLAAPAGAAVAPSGSAVPQDRYGPHECYGGHAGPARGNCYDEREPQHDGSGSLLF